MKKNFFTQALRLNSGLAYTQAIQAIRLGQRGGEKPSQNFLFHSWWSTTLKRFLSKPSRIDALPFFPSCVSTFKILLIKHGPILQSFFFQSEGVDSDISIIPLRYRGGRLREKKVSGQDIMSTDTPRHSKTGREMTWNISMTTKIRQH